MAFGVTPEFQESFMEEIRSLTDEELSMLMEDVNRDVDDGHLVELAEESVRTTTDYEEKRQILDRQLLAAYENDMPELRAKEAWQTKITLPSIFTTCFQAKSMVRKAVADKPEFFDWVAVDAEDEPANQKADFWKDALQYWCRRAKFQTAFPDMTEMAFVQGISQAIKCVYHLNQNGPDSLEILKINAEKIYRDPDAKPRQPQSGLYCIHQDWVDYHELLKGQERGEYINIDPSIWTAEDEYGSSRRRERNVQNRQMNFSSRNRFRKSVKVTEYWGDILDHNSELVMSNVRFTVANRTVIKRPEQVLFPTIRWPIHQFSSIPHFDRFHGISLVEGIFRLWKLRNNIICMATDKLSFALNTMYELDPSILQNASDTEIYPGALKFRRPNKQGNAYSEIKMSAKLDEIAPLWEMTGTEMQNGSFVTDLIRGTMSRGTDPTATEQKIQYQQGLGVFESIGRDVEEGGVDALRMIQEFLLVAWSPEDHPTFLPFLRRHPEVSMMLMTMDPNDRIEALNVEADVSIRGVSLMMEKSELLQQIKDLMAISDSPRFAPYVKDDELIQKAGDAMGLEEAIKTLDELEVEQKAQREAIANQGLPPPGLTGAPPVGSEPMIGAQGMG